MQMQTKQYRQGDVLLVSATQPNCATMKHLPKSERIVLAYGEATGHHHSVAAEHCEEWVDDAGVTWLEVRKAVELLHQEHAPVPLAPGWYRKVQQREYSPAAIHNVAD